LLAALGGALDAIDDIARKGRLWVDSGQWHRISAQAK